MGWQVISFFSDKNKLISDAFREQTLITWEMDVIYQYNI